MQQVTLLPLLWKGWYSGFSKKSGFCIFQINAIRALSVECFQLKNIVSHNQTWQSSLIGRHKKIEKSPSPHQLGYFQLLNGKILKKLGKVHSTNIRLKSVSDTQYFQYFKKLHLADYVFQSAFMLSDQDFILFRWKCKASLSVSLLSVEFLIKNLHSLNIFCVLT